MRFGLVIGSVFLAAVGVSAHADTVSGTGTTPDDGNFMFSGSGTLTATANDDGSALIVTALSGTYNPILLAPGSFQDNDNVLLPTQTPSLTSNGLAFTATMGSDTFTVDLYGTDPTDPQLYRGFLVDDEGSQENFLATFLLVGTQAVPPLGGQPSLQPGETMTYDYSFSADATGVTPEPSSMVLLGTGLLGLAGLAKRRWAA